MKKIFFLALVIFMLLNVSAFAKYEEGQAVDAVKSTQRVSVDGKVVKIEGYLIDGSNYFKIRDVASIVSGTDKEFDVVYDKENGKMHIYLDKKYSGNADTSTIDKIKAKGIVKQGNHLIDDVSLYLETILIDGNNYVKLRDVSKFVGFSLGYDSVKREVEVLTEDVEYVEKEELNDGDSLDKLGDVSLSDIKDLNKSLKNEFKFDIEEAPSGVKFYSHINGKKERFYLNKYKDSYSSWLRGMPERDFNKNFYDETRKQIKYFNDLIEKIEKAGKENIKIRLDAYNYILFAKIEPSSKGKKYVTFNQITHDMFGRTKEGIELPLSFYFYNSIGVGYSTIYEDSVDKSGEAGVLKTKPNLIPLGVVKTYTVDKDGNKKLFTNYISSSKSFEKDVKMLIFEYTINRVKGKILVYFI